MSPPRPDKRDVRRPKNGARLHKRPGHAYVAKLVSAADLRHFVQAHGGGDEAMMWVAARQLDVISTIQLHLAGIGRSAIESRHSHGLLRPMYRGVYLVGHSVPVPGAWELGAVLACGEDTFVSHRSAAALWLLMPPPVLTEVTVVGRNCRSRERLRVHRTSSLDARACTLRFGIPVTTVARTVIDLAVDTDGHVLERAIADGLAQRLLQAGELEAEMDRCRGHAGVGKLRAILKAQGGPALTRSEAERLMRRLLKAAGLPQAQINARVEGFEVDFYWPAHKLVVEVDGYQFHGDRAAFERDRRKGLVLAAAGLNVIRITWRQLVEEPVWVAVQLARALAGRS